MGRNRAKEKIQAHRHARMERREQAKTEQRQVNRGGAVPGAGGGGAPVMEQGGKKNKRSNKSCCKVTPSAGGDVNDDTLGGDVESDNHHGASTSTNYNEDECSGDNPQFNKSLEACSSNSSKVEIDTGNKNLSKAFYAEGGNPNHRMELKPVWRYDYEESQARTKNKGRSIDANISSTTKLLEDYFLPEDIVTIKSMWGAKQEYISPAVAAVALNRFDVLKKILKEDNAMDCLTQEGQYLSPLGCAIVTSNWEMIEFMLDKDLVRAVNCKDIFGNTALVKAVLCKDWIETAFCELLSRMEDEDIDLQSSNMAGVTLLHAICYRGWTAALQTLIELIDSRPQKQTLRSWINTAMKDGTTPLMLAADIKCEELCAFLLSEGANPLAEDKAGYSALCRSLTSCTKTPILSRGCIPPIFKLILSALDELHDQGESWDFEVYFSKTLQAVTNPDAVFSCERFYRLGRFVFLFLLRCTVGGPGLFLSLKFFSKLCNAGQKHLHQIDYLYTICLTWFEILVYSEDMLTVESNWNKYVNAFVREGAADFCLKVLQRWTSVVDSNSDISGDPSSKPQSNRCHSNPLDPDGIENFESLAIIDSPVPVDKNMAMTALLPFIQLIDALGMDRWFSKNFSSISSCYKSMKKIGTSVKTALNGGHILRTNQKAVLFHAVMSQENWTTLYGDKPESWMPRDHKNKKNKNKPAQRNGNDKVFRIPTEILQPSPEIIGKEQSGDEDQRKNESKTLSAPRVRKRRSPDKDVSQQYMCTPSLQSLQPSARKDAKISSSAVNLGSAQDNKPKSNSISKKIIETKDLSKVPVEAIVEKNIRTTSTTTVASPMPIVFPPRPSNKLSTLKDTEKRFVTKMKRQTSAYAIADKFQVLQIPCRIPEGMFSEPFKISYEEDMPMKVGEQDNLLGPVTPSSPSCNENTVLDETRSVGAQTSRLCCFVTGQTNANGRPVRRRVDI